MVSGWTALPREAPQARRKMAVPAAVVVALLALPLAACGDDEPAQNAAAPPPAPAAQTAAAPPAASAPPSGGPNAAGLSAVIAAAPPPPALPPPLPPSAPAPAPAMAPAPAAAPAVPPAAPAIAAAPAPAAEAPAAPRPRPRPQPGDTVTGLAAVVEGDVLSIDGMRVMLWGLETVEPPQTCRIGRDPWQCYPAVVRALETIVGVAPVTCIQVGELDPFGRMLATCEVAGTNVNEAFVRTGFALAKRDETMDYVPAEDAAKAEKIGLWQGTFMHPKDFRLDRGIEVDRP